jgi:hypothetical protein
MLFEQYLRSGRSSVMNSGFGRSRHIAPPRERDH